VVADDCILGAHVEAARSVFGSGVKISHRAFVGDSTIGDLTVIGAGVVFCNFDGRQRQSTLIGARVTLGSGVLVIPPVSVGNDAIVGAGSVVNKDVPPGVKVIQKRYACEVNGHHGRIAE
jgi:bifunctional UDP-N-acetylglucosamine pyrophosphorylase/glucosamine-1-phosphate N-acetyltransferase